MMIDCCTPPGWQYNPSLWSQHLPIVALALVGFDIYSMLVGFLLISFAMVRGETLPQRFSGRWSVL